MCAAYTFGLSGEPFQGRISALALWRRLVARAPSLPNYWQGHVANTFLGVPGSPSSQPCERSVMKAISIKEPGGPEVLEWIEVEDPLPEAGEVVVDVAA